MVVRGAGPSWAVVCLAVALSAGCEAILGIGHSSARLVDAGTGPILSTPNDAGDALAPGQPIDAAPGVPRDAPVDLLRDAAAVDGRATIDVGADGGPGRVDAPTVGVDAATADAGRTCPAGTMMRATAFRLGSGPHGGGGQGLCSFPNASLPLSRFYAAVDPDLYRSAAACGVCLLLRGSSGATVEVQVIDRIGKLPAANGFTISVDDGARLKLDPTGGNPTVAFGFVPCTAAKTLQVGFAEPNFPAVLLFDHRTQPTKVEIRNPLDAAFVTLTRQSYNQWTPPGGFDLGGGTAVLRVTDQLGDVLVIPNLQIAASVLPALHDTAQQFPGCAP